MAVQKPILFLDFDGVLHPSIAEPDRHFEQALVLEQALGESPVGIVISSSWRHHHPMEEILGFLPAGLARRVLGRTGQGIAGRHARWQEITSYCQTHRICDWRALDDAWFEFPPGCPQLLRCDGAKGLASAQVAALQHWLAS